MTRIILCLMFGFLILISYSVQADGKNWHQHNHDGKHLYKHSGNHYNLHSGYRNGCRNGRHNHYRGQTQFYTVPQVAVGTRYGYSASGAVVVYQPYRLKHHRY